MNNLLLRRHSIIGAGNVSSPLVGEPVYHPDAFKLTVEVPSTAVDGETGVLELKLFGDNFAYTKVVIDDGEPITSDTPVAAAVPLTAGTHTVYVWGELPSGRTVNQLIWFGPDATYVTYMRYPVSFNLRNRVGSNNCWCFRGHRNLKQIDIVSSIGDAFNPAIESTSAFDGLDAAAMPSIRIPKGTLALYQEYFANISKVLNVLEEYEFTIIED